MGSVVRRASVGVHSSRVETWVVGEVVAPVSLMHSSSSSSRIPVHPWTIRSLGVVRILGMPAGSADRQWRRCCGVVKLHPLVMEAEVDWLVRSENGLTVGCAPVTTVWEACDVQRIIYARKTQWFRPSFFHCICQPPPTNADPPPFMSVSTGSDLIPLQWPPPCCTNSQRNLIR